jgi:hypothetical protein
MDPSETVLLSTTTWWPAPARLAMAFRNLGLRVHAICPPGHPLHHTRAVSQCFRYSYLHPVGVLRNAIKTTRPAFIVPCDDRAVDHLHMLHDADPDAGIRALITNSLGSTTGFHTLESRHQLLGVAAAEGIRVPAWALVRSEADLDQWHEPLPWVIKCGMSWGGAGVRIVYNRAEAKRAFRTMARPVGIGRAMKRVLINGDGFSLAPSLARRVPEVIIQRFIDGEPASTTMACWQGTMVSQLSVRALSTQGATGASTVIEVIEQNDMTAAASGLAARLGLSGFHGLDFVRDSSGAAWLIEFNPRATQVCHLAIGDGMSLAEAFMAVRNGGRKVGSRVAPIGSTIALFPQAWRSDPRSPLLATASHDVPWEEPDLVSDLMAPPWPNRGLIPRLWQEIFESKIGKDYWAGAAPVATNADKRTSSVSIVPGSEATAKRKLPA